MGATAVACVLYHLDAGKVADALGNAATTAGGLVGSSGTHGKPFHAGKAAMDGILVADLAAADHVSASHLFELENGWLDAFIQDRNVEVPPLDFAERFGLLRNGYKLLASCRATHASAQAAHQLAGQFDLAEVETIEAQVHPGALVTAGKLSPPSPLEAKFSVFFCVAMALNGYRLVWTDFSDAVFADARVAERNSKVRLQPVDGQSPASAHVIVHLRNGTTLRADTNVILGHPENSAMRGRRRC